MIVARRRILIVDGDRARAAATHRMLSAPDRYTVAIAAPGAEATEVAAGTAPDLVLADLQVPAGKDFVTAAAAIRQAWRVPVVLMLDGTDEAGFRSRERPELQGSIARPFTGRELFATIELALCRHDAARGVHDLDDGFFAVSIDMLCFLGFNGYFTRLNPAWERTLGFTREELTSRPFIEFVHPDDRERTLRQNRVVRSGGQALAFENRYVCKDGSYRWLRWNAAADSTERVIYSVARDVTAEKQAAEERELLLGQLQAALSEVRTLRDILPICSYCKKIRDDEDYWHTVESYVLRHTGTQFSHGVCPHCMETIVEPQIDALDG